MSESCILCDQPRVSAYYCHEHHPSCDLNEVEVPVFLLVRARDAKDAEIIVRERLNLWGSEHLIPYPPWGRYPRGKLLLWRFGIKGETVEGTQ